MLGADANSGFFNTSAVGMLEKLLFWKYPNDLLTFWLLGVHVRSMKLHFLMTCNKCFWPCVGMISLDVVFHGLQMCVSRPVWDRMLEFWCSIGEVLRSGSLEILLQNAAKHVVPWRTSQTSTSPYLRGAYCVFLTCAKLHACMDLHAVAGKAPQYQQRDTT